ALLGNIGTGLVHEVGKDRSRARALYARAITLSALLGLIGAVALVPLDLTFAQQDYRVVTFAVVGLVPLLLTQTISSMLLALGRVRLWNVLQLVLPATTLLGMLVLIVGLSKGVTGAITAWVAGQTVAAFIGLTATRAMWWPPVGLRSLGGMRPLFLFGLRIGVVNLLSLINYRIELIILERYRGLNGVGIYSLAVSLAELLWLVSSAVATVLVAPAIQSDEKRAVEVVSAGVRHALLGTALLAVALGVMSPWLVPTLFGPRFQPAVAALLILLPGMVAFAPATVLAVFFSMRIGRARYAFFLALGSALTTALLAVLLIPRFGLEGAALASTIGYVSSIVIALGLFVRLTHVSVAKLLPSLKELVVYRNAVLRLAGRA
ncbi:MAG TPA: oligosaccharide flippase family protein, partial [Gaiellaceae bacterium]|nr:oligosaccharide flippase family protein [Gaiellaceae bacterium]